MIRSARALLSIASDPDFPARQQYAGEIAGKLLQLEDSWEALNDPITDTEVDRFIQRHFPDKPRLGSPA
jgi:hypothetical protein